jgi:hypothetical protein
MHCDCSNTSNTPQPQPTVDRRIDCLRHQPVRAKSKWVVYAGLSHLAKLTQLERLQLSKTKFTDAGLAHLSGLNQLEVLDLRDTHITNRGLAQLIGRSGILVGELVIDGTEITPEASRRIFPHVVLRPRNYFA